MLLFFMMICASIPHVDMKVYAEGEEEVYILHDKRPYLFVDQGTSVDLSLIAYNTPSGDVLLTDGIASNVSSELTINATTLVASDKGIFNFTFTTGEESIVVYVFSKLASDTSYTIYEMDFSDYEDGELPSDYTLVRGGTAGIENGYLFLDSPATSTPTQVTLPQYLAGFKNYIIETDFSILSAVENTRWASIMYRFADNNYFQMCIRQNATATNGVEFAKSINGNWNVPVTTAYAEMISAESIYRVKIDLFGSVVNEYINDSLLITYENANDYSDGLIGFQASGAKAVFNNILVTMPEEYIDNSSVDYSAIPTVYTPESNIITPPSAIKMADSLQDLEDLKNDIRPQIIVFRINGNLDVTDEGGLPFMNINDVFEYYNERVIPAFYTKNAEIATSIASLLKSYGVRDVFLISPNDDALLAARAEYNMIRGVFEVRYDPEKPVLSDDDLIEIRDITNSSGAIVAKLPIEYTNQYNVFYIQERLVSVWTDTFDLSTVEVYQGLLSGVNGMVIDDYLSLYDIFMDFPVNTMLRRPITIAHRGLSSQAPENSMTSVDLAINAGTDVVELDIYLTIDNEIVVIHDSSTTRTFDQTLIVEDSTLAQLRALTMLDTFGFEESMVIPTLKDYFTRIQDTNVILFVEIKSSKPEIIDYLKQLIDEYDVSSQIVVITFNANQIARMKEVLPQISNGYLSTALLSSTNLESSIRATLNAVVPLQSTINPEYSALTYEFVVQMNYRGLSIWPWTLNTTEAYYQYYMMGVGGLTTNYCDNLLTTFNRFSLNTNAFILDLFEPSTSPVRGVIKTQSGMNYNYVPTLTLIDDGGTGIVMDELSNIVSYTAVGDAYYIASFTTTLPSGDEFTIYSDVIHISVIDSTPTEEPVIEEPIIEEPESDTTSPISLGWIIGGISGAIIVLGGSLFVGLRFLRKPKI